MSSSNFWSNAALQIVQMKILLPQHGRERVSRECYFLFPGPQIGSGVQGGWTTSLPVGFGMI
jgi:hypothetical protein